MYKRTLAVLLFFSAVLFSCQNAGQPTAEPGTDPVAAPGSEESVLAQLKREALPSDDLLGRLKQGLVRLQEGYDQAEGRMPSVKEVEVSIDAECLLSISNKAAGGTMVQVNLKDLDTNGLSLIPDLAQGEFPGLRIKTIEQKPTVLHYQGGRLVDKGDELVIYLADRTAIESVTPAILQSIYLCQGLIE